MSNRKDTALNKTFIKDIEKKLDLTQEECELFLKLRVNYLQMLLENSIGQDVLPSRTGCIQNLESENNELLEEASDKVLKALELYLLQNLKDLGYDTSSLPIPENI